GGGWTTPRRVRRNLGEGLFRDWVARSDGFVFTGGADLTPKHYGQDKHQETHVMHDRRDALELDLFRAADAADKPILAICLGCQVAAVARGGCLVQHVDDVTRRDAVTHHLP